MSIRLTLSVALLAAATAAQDAHPFRTQNLDFGQMGSDLAAGDFDEDGWPDLIVNGFGGASLARNDGQGGLPQLATGLPGQPTELIDLPGVGGLAFVHVIDLDGDGHLDVLGSEYPGDLIHVVLGDGVAGFATSVTYSAPSDPGGLGSGDFDHDGDLDVVVVGRSVDRARVYENVGGGALVTASDYLTGDHSDSVAVGDFDEDGELDFVSGNRHADTFRLYLGGSGMAFTDGGLFPIGYNPHNIKAVDIDGDGHLDVLVGTGDIGDDRVSFRLGDGAGGFAPLSVLHVGGRYPLDPWLADFDEDGLDDLIVTSAIDEGLYRLRGLGGGAFAPGEYVPTSNNPQGMLVVDLDQDGDLDVAVSHVNSDILTVLHGQGDGRFGGNHAVGLLPRDVAVGDLDGDGRPDLLASTEGDNSLWALAALGAGRFAPASAVPTGGATDELELGDLDGDGHLDALVSRGNSQLVSLPGLGDGGFGAAVVAADVGSLAEDLHVAQLDGDGLLDAVIIGGGATRVLLGLGDGTFAAPLSLSGSSFGVAVGDVNGDGFLDLVDQQVVDLETGGLTAHLGDGAGGFSRGTSSPTGVNYGHRLALGDVDEDGLLDAALNGSSNNTEIMLGAGDGSFVHGSDVLQYTHLALTVALADLDGDGHLDLMHGGSWWGTTSGSLTYNAGLGDGTFGAPAWIVLGSVPAHGVVADIDQDGAPDLVFAVTEEFGSNGTEAHHLSILTNKAGAWTGLGHPLAGSNGTPTFVSAGPLTAGSTIEHHLTDARHAGTGWFVIGFADLSAPFKGGLLIPTPDILLPIPLDGDGAASLVDTWPAGLPSGAELFYQWFIADPAGPAGWSASNGMLATLP